MKNHFALVNSLFNFRFLDALSGSLKTFAKNMTSNLNDLIE